MSYCEVWYRALDTDDAKQQPVMHGAELGKVLLAKIPRTASVEVGLARLCHFRLVVQLMQVYLLMRFQLARAPRHFQRVAMYVCMVITYSRVWINRVRLPILLVVS